MSQEQFADKLGIGHAHVSKIEKGNGIPSELLLRHICSELFVSKTWLTTGEGEMFVSADEILRNTFYPNEQVLYDACKKIIDDKNLMVMDSATHKYLSRNNDPDLDHMIRFLNDLWAVADDNMKAWARVQFSRAFPPDVEDEVQKKHAEKQGRESTA
jgi:transcriptional regulator with XRE-family HTH domain